MTFLHERPTVHKERLGRPVSEPVVNQSEGVASSIPAKHSSSHESGGSDVMDISGLTDIAVTYDSVVVVSDNGNVVTS